MSSRLAEDVLRRDRAITLVALAGLVLLAWAYLVRGGGMAMGISFAMVATMWFVMMIAMMLPSAAPAILLYARVERSRSDSAIPPAWLFMAGYILAWLCFSLAAAAAQIALVAGGWVEEMALRATLPGLAGAVLVAAGAYQLSPLKNACLRQCRSPAAFITSHFRPGAAGAVRLGLLHGAYCVGCCWLLMVLLFVGGVMNLAWVALLTVLVAAEKLLPGGKWIARVSGIAMVGGGIVLLAA